MKEPIIYYRELKTRIEMIMRDEHLTQKDFAEACGIKYTTLNSVMRGHITNPETRFMIAICTRFDVDMNWLCGIKQSNHDAFFEQIKLELIRAKKKHPKYPKNIFEKVAIISEEAGEVAKAALDNSHGKGTIDEIKKELIQTCAVCLRMLETL